MAAMSAYFSRPVTDFERAPWLPVSDLARERSWCAEVVAEAVHSDNVYEYHRKLASDVHAMRAEDLRVGAAYAAAWRSWQVDAELVAIATSVPVGAL